MEMVTMKSFASALMDIGGKVLVVTIMLSLIWGMFIVLQNTLTMFGFDGKRIVSAVTYLYAIIISILSILFTCMIFVHEKSSWSIFKVIGPQIAVLFVISMSIITDTYLHIDIITQYGIKNPIDSLVVQSLFVTSCVSIVIGFIMEGLVDIKERIVLYKYLKKRNQ